MMRAHAMFALAAVAGTLAFAQPAAAQGRYYDDERYDHQQCEREQRDRVVAGALFGAIVGGVLGNNIAAGGHQGDGTIVGGLVGGVTGAAIAHGSGDGCGDRYGYSDDDHRYVSDDSYYGDDDEGYYEDDGRRYAENEHCRWGDMEYVDRRGRSRGSERVWMCMGRDGVWRPTE